jgi:hypothetical protein
MTRELSLIGDELDEAGAAALAAVAYLLDQEDRARVAAGGRPPSRSGWRDAARLGAQGVALSRPVAALGWGRVERLRRTGRGGGGVVGQ